MASSFFLRIQGGKKLIYANYTIVPGHSPSSASRLAWATTIFQGLHEISRCSIHIIKLGFGFSVSPFFSFFASTLKALE